MAANINSTNSQINPNLHFGGVPQASPHPNISRVSAQNLSMMAKRLGRCGDINPLTGYVCVTQPHPPQQGQPTTKHAAIQIGGPNDGKVYSEW